MHAIAQKCRPKHQVLVLKCYPRTTKGAVDVKPNSSELSYLLFYAQSRRSKIQKVASFLEKKTASDVYRQRIGNVQVTLQILTALIEKTPKDLPLFASCVLQILEQILKSQDITMVESSLPTFAAFCAHHEPASLMAEQAYLRQYLSVVQQYASLASTRAFPGRLEPSKPMALRWRNAGLRAIRSIAASDALSSATTQQYDAAVPMILENLWTDNEDFLDVLHERAEVEEKLGGALLRRRTSAATVQTAESESAAHPLALAPTAVDMDKLDEEDTGVLAMECLRHIFSASGRSQIHSATLALLRFIHERVAQEEPVVRSDASGRDAGWAIKMFLLAARWAPVADRFTILVTAVGSLAQQPLTDDTLRQHIALAAMIGALLRSDVNLIGLSVMDVLLQLVAHIRRLPDQPDQPDPRSELLWRLQECIGALATHIYYADQVSDMVAAILQKLKPSRSGSRSGSPHGEKADGSPKSSAPALSAADESHADSLFALAVAKIAALRAIRSVLLVANARAAAAQALSRSRVPIHVWDGTQWLLRDPDGLVRKAYVEALLTWLDRETSRADARAWDDAARASPKGREAQATPLARRVVSSASGRDMKPGVKAQRASQCLQLLHLAVYDNAIQYIDYDSDMVLLHVLLAKLVDKLGINAVRSGLPMIFRLQEDIQDAETPLQKVRLGSLVHGYLWALTERFELDGSAVGRLVHNEIVRRRSKHFWVDGVHVPAPALDRIGTPGNIAPEPRLPTDEVESEALLPFDEREALVDSVCAAHQDQTASPVQSPAASPGRSFAHPVGSLSTSTIPTIEANYELPLQFREDMLAEWSREAVLAAAQATSKSASINGSRSGTTATRLHANGGAAAAAAAAAASAANGQSLRPDRSSPHGSRTNLRPSSSPGLAIGGGGGGGMVGLGGGLDPGRVRKSSLRSARSAAVPPSSTNGNPTPVTSVEQLKLVLSGRAQPPPPPPTAPAAMATMHGMFGGSAIGLARGDDDSNSSDSLVSYDMTASELSFNPIVGTAVSGPADATAAATTTTTTTYHSQPHLHPQTLPQNFSHPRPSSRGVIDHNRRPSASGGPPGSHPAADEALAADAGAVPPVPPVPPLPSGLSRGPSSAGDSTRHSPALPTTCGGSGKLAQPLPGQEAVGVSRRPSTSASKRSVSNRYPDQATQAQAQSPGFGLGRVRSRSTSSRSQSHERGVLPSSASSVVVTDALARGRGSVAAAPAVMDLDALLQGIDARVGEEIVGGGGLGVGVGLGVGSGNGPGGLRDEGPVTKPPY
ncbi:hypothetical protein VTJ83DRAFT_1780 [Remersonia thermophila]|uniref:Protein EFR3 n=1 Tax=Remersonia thermophila TaxID=72144 RepID=A0ABR4DGW4_9PEZI